VSVSTTNTSCVPEVCPNIYGHHQTLYEWIMLILLHDWWTSLQRYSWVITLTFMYLSFCLALRDPSRLGSPA
jgi:hypothetical protein